MVASLVRMGRSGLWIVIWIQVSFGSWALVLRPSTLSRGGGRSWGLIVISLGIRASGGMIWDAWRFSSRNSHMEKAHVDIALGGNWSGEPGSFSMLEIARNSLDDAVAFVAPCLSLSCKICLLERLEDFSRPKPAFCALDGTTS